MTTLWSCLLSAVASGCAIAPVQANADGGITNVPAATAISQVSKPRDSTDQERVTQLAHSEPLPDKSASPGQSQALAQTTPGPNDGSTAVPQANNMLPPPRSLPLEPGHVPSDAQTVVQPLVLEEVIASVETNFPLLLAVVQEQGITSGQLLSAQGAFDLNLRTREFWQVGTFESNRFNIGVDQNTSSNGLSYYAGYRQSVGDFPIYYGDRKTGDGGEFRAGVLIPLLANRAIDKRRAVLQQAAITRAMADPVIATQRLDFVRAASRAYWTWVATGSRYRIAQSVLQIAEDRDKQLTELVQRGAVAEIERTDNQRVIVERQARLIAAERAWQQASIALSLYLRGPSAEPQLPSATRLPKEVVEPTPIDRAVVAKDIEFALQQRPELQRLRLQRERIMVELDLARNQSLPGLNLGVEGAQDVGAGSAYSKTPLVTGTQLDRTAYIASLQLDVPLQQRDAKGRALAAQAALVQLRFQEQFQRDRIVAELQDAASALERSYDLLKKARENIAVARKVEAGERERFSSGQGTIVILNLRELVAAEASFAEVDALAEYCRSLADYQAAKGFGLK